MLQKFQSVLVKMMYHESQFYLIEKCKLQELCNHAEIIIQKSFFVDKVIDKYQLFLNENAKELQALYINEDIYYGLLIYLKKEKGIDLTESEHYKIKKELIDKRGYLHFIFTYQQKSEFLGRLNNLNSSMQDLQKFISDFIGEYDLQTLEQVSNAFSLLLKNLQELDNDEKVLLLILQANKIYLLKNEKNF